MISWMMWPAESQPPTETFCSFVLGFFPIPDTQRIEAEKNMYVSSEGDGLSKNLKVFYQIITAYFWAKLISNMS